jgi:hypothetical protein
MKSTSVVGERVAAHEVAARERLLPANYPDFLHLIYYFYPDFLLNKVFLWEKTINIREK